jgi:hypothetical protein
MLSGNMRKMLQAIGSDILFCFADQSTEWQEHFPNAMVVKLNATQHG